MGPPKVHSEEASSLIRQLLTPDLDMRLKSAVEVKVRSESPSQGHLWVTRDFQLLKIHLWCISEKDFSRGNSETLMLRC